MTRISGKETSSHHDTCCNTMKKHRDVIAPNVPQRSDGWYRRKYVHGLPSDPDDEVRGLFDLGFLYMVRIV